MSLRAFYNVIMSTFSTVIAEKLNNETVASAMTSLRAFFYSSLRAKRSNLNTVKRAGIFENISAFYFVLALILKDCFVVTLLAMTKQVFDVSFCSMALVLKKIVSLTLAMTKSRLVVHSQ
jgi:hypothetical protein